jgi:cellobiose phosphorylase
MPVNCGYFDDARREYVITNPKTPVKWINYIGTLAFGGFVDHTGGALICSQDPALNRITRYLPQLPAGEFKGETLYVRVKAEGGGYQVYTPFFVPALQPLERFECRVGLGYSCFIAEFAGLRTEVTVFVPHAAACELRLITVTNLSAHPQQVDLIPLVEYTHFDALKQLTNADWVPQTMQSDAVEQPAADGQPAANEQPGGLMILVQYAFMLRDTRINYFTSNLPASSYETERVAFLGDNEYAGWGAPLGLQKEYLGNSRARRGDNIAALLHPLGWLKPGESRTLITQLGQVSIGARRDIPKTLASEAQVVPLLEAALPTIKAYRDPARVEQALQELVNFWDTSLSALQVGTPDPAMNSMLNVHNPRQCYITLSWSRYLSLYQLGYGARGIGFRDTAQDVMGALALAPQEAADRLRLLLQIQKRDGSAMHQVNPLTMIASEGDSLEVEEGPHYYSDDHLWAIPAVCAYLKETGDRAFLEEVIPYYEKDKARRPLKSGSVLDHLRGALAFTHGNLGAHDLPLLGFADWNDTVNLRRGAESLFTANLYGKALLEMCALLECLGEGDEAQLYRSWYEQMRQQVNAVAWDGSWYLRYFDASGEPLGSQQNQHGQIYVNAQSWAVISGLATPERARQSLEAVYRLLNTRNGIKLSAPGFNGYDPARGGVTTYPPGAKENGGIFLHANPWAIIAETLVGNGERAFQYYTQINPAAKNDRIEVYQCEPYVYAQNILGDEHPQFGLARNSWLTGTASWAYQAATQYILGIRPEYDGLRVDPCLPPAWDGFRAVRCFRGVVYHIQVYNPGHVCRGVKELHVDDRRMEGCIAPFFPEGGAHTVEVWLGV